MASDREPGSMPPSEPLEPGSHEPGSPQAEIDFSDVDAEPLAVHVSRALNLRRLMIEQGLPPIPVVLDHFEFVRMIGRGGMGRVFEAVDTRLNRRVAIKICGSTEDEHVQLFAREARLLAMVRHVNVVTIHGVFEARGELAIVMEFIQGRTLREWVCQEDPPWREILARFDAAGCGLEAIHAAGLEHGDFKPDNVMVGDDGVVRVLDLGVARSRSELSSADASSSRRLAGTLAYLPPEQVRLENAAASRGGDVFAFCASIWDMVLGDRNYAVAHLLLDRTPETIKEYRPPLLGAPAELVAVLQRGLSWTPAKRWQTIGEVRAALREVVHGREQVVARRWEWAGVGAGAAVGTIFALAAVFVFAAVAAKRPATEQAPAENLTVPEPPAATAGPATVDQSLALAQHEVDAPEGDPKSAVRFLEIAHSKALRHERGALRRVAEHATAIGDDLTSQDYEQALLSWGVARSCYRDLGEIDNMKAMDLRPTFRPPRVPRSK